MFPVKNIVVKFWPWLGNADQMRGIDRIKNRIISAFQMMCIMGCNRVCAAHDPMLPFKVLNECDNFVIEPGAEKLHKQVFDNVETRSR